MDKYKITLDDGSEIEVEADIFSVYNGNSITLMKKEQIPNEHMDQFNSQPFVTNHKTVAFLSCVKSAILISSEANGEGS